MDEMTDMITSRINEARNVIADTRDAKAQYAAGVIDFEAYCEKQGKHLAALRVLAKAEAGEAVTDEEFVAMIAEATEEAALPTQEEVNAANIDFLLMMGGEE